MRNYKEVLIIFVFMPFLGTPIEASDNIKPWTNIRCNFRSAYSDRSALYHISALGLTYALVESGYDAKILEKSSQINADFRDIYGHSGIYSGYLLPIVIPVSMFFGSEKNSDTRTVSYALMQSVSVAFAAGTVLKAITGRKPPQLDHPDKDILSRDFRFGFMEGGLHYGWPSGHLMVNTAFITTLSAFYPEKSWIQYLSYGYITFLTTSVLLNGEAHWFSDIVAGGLMGYSIGSVIGKNFYQFRNGNINRVQNSTTQFYSLIDKNITGFSFSFKF